MAAARMTYLFLRNAPNIPAAIAANDHMPHVMFDVVKYKPAPAAIINGTHKKAL